MKGITRLAPATPPKFPEPPAYLAAPEAEVWRVLVAQYDLLDPPGLLLLGLLCRSLQLARECRERVAADGLLVDGKEHPLLRALRDAERQGLAAQKALNFDVEPLRDHPGRPPGGRGGR